jgi:hypothetical protein
MENQPKKLNKIVRISIIAGITIITLSVAYYLAIFLPQKQKASIEITKLELEAKIEQEKTEQVKIEQMKSEDEAKKRAELLEEEKRKEELEKKKGEESIQKNNNAGTIKKSCNDSALEKARKRYQDIYDDDSDKYFIAHYESYYNQCLREKGL